MSTILDALKKSEQERKLNQVPRLSDMPTPQEPTKWTPAILTVLILILLSLCVLVYQIAGESASSNQPTNEALTDHGEQALVVNVVSYSTNPQQRFALVNGEIVREQDVIRPGLKVESIELDKVIFNQQGRLIEKQP